MQAHYPSSLFLPHTTTLSSLQDGRSPSTLPTVELYPIGDSATSANTVHGFSEGSPAAVYHPDHGYPYYLDRGGPSTSISGPQAGQHATGMADPDNPCTSSSAFVYPATEEIATYHQTWLPLSIHGNPHPTSSLAESITPAATFEPPTSALKSTLSHVPAALNPTPSQMAILMRPPGAPADVPPAVNERQPAPPLEEDFTLSRERKHACTMCHKRFDRPSTLRKHLLVHTGEKAFQCGTCGRRFGVASNLNRHVRRCVLKPVNVLHSSTSPTASASPEASTPGVASPIEHSMELHSNNVPRISETGRLQTSEQHLSGNTYALQVSQPRSGRAAATGTRAALQKRRRRAPSPSRWIPDSLRGFIFQLESVYRTSAVPLPPVRPGMYEERNSWDENVGQAPYHPREWDRKPQLPGPGMSVGFGLGGRDVGNLNLGGGREQMMGRVNVLVF